MSNHLPADELTRELSLAAGHPNPNVRAAAALALGRIGEQQTLDILVKLLTDQNHTVQRRAAKAIGMLGAPAVGALLGYLEEQSDSRFQQRLADALGQIRDQDAVDMLSASVNYLDPPARYGAIDALGAIGDSGSIPALIQATRSDDPQSRHKAAQALLKVGAEEAVTALSAMLDHPDPRLRVFAVEGLGKIGGEQSVLSLLAVLNDDDETVRQATADALKQIRVPAAEEIFLTAINTQSAWVQQTIAAALGSYPAEQVVERLHRLLAEQGDLSTRMTAAQSLARLGDVRGSRLIHRTLNAPNSETRRLAAIALGMTGSPDAVPHLVEALHQKSIDLSTPAGRRLRRQLAEAMAAVGEPMIPALLNLLAEEDAFIRQLAQDSLARQGSRVVFPLIAAVESHPSPGVRVQAARLLGRVGDPQAVDTLSAVLRSVLVGPYPVVFFTRLFWDRSTGLRAASAGALGDIGALDGASILLSSARFDPDETVRQAAETALGNIGAPAVTARFAQVDVIGFVNRVLTAAVLFLAAGFLSGLINLLWGLPDAALLAGLVVGAAIGGVDGLRGSKRASQGALIGALAAVGFSWVLSGFREPWMFGLASVIFPSVGGLLGWKQMQLTERLAGLFGGMVLGFLGAGIAVLILGTIS